MEKVLVILAPEFAVDLINLIEQNRMNSVPFRRLLRIKPRPPCLSILLIMASAMVGRSIKAMMKLECENANLFFSDHSPFTCFDTKTYIYYQ